MILKIILGISLVGFLGFEVFNLVMTLRQRSKRKRTKRAEQDVAADKETDKEVKD